MRVALGLFMWLDELQVSMAARYTLLRLWSFASAVGVPMRDIAGDGAPNAGVFIPLSIVPVDMFLRQHGVREALAELVRVKIARFDTSLQRLAIVLPPPEQLAIPAMGHNIRGPDQDPPPR